MKRKVKSVTAKIELNELFPADAILNDFEKQQIKGGDGDGGGDIILIPKPPQGGN